MDMSAAADADPPSAKEKRDEPTGFPRDDVLVATSATAAAAAVRSRTTSAWPGLAWLLTSGARYQRVDT